MVEKRKKQRKATICEEDISTLLHRYSPTTVLGLLQEVAQVPHVKIDWNELAKKTSTGISNAREYQMLWRHLAYRDKLSADRDEPLDDDSDLDNELETLPPVSYEASTEAAACVKVLIASGLQSGTNLPNGSTVEGPLTINIPNGQSYRSPSENSQLQGTNITVPVFVQKPSHPTVAAAEGSDANGPASGNLPARRKRKQWSAAEDLELIAAVQKCGEGNWASILKGDFKGDRTASQLSQRWASLRKRQGNLNVGGGSQLSEAQLAARRAVSLALNMPMVDNLRAACSNGGINPNNTSSNSIRPAVAVAPLVVAQSQNQSLQDSAPSTSLQSRVIQKKLPTKHSFNPDAMVKAAAVAAGARIATTSDAALLLKAAQAKNAVHISAGGGPLIKSSAGTALPSNVHFIRTGLVASLPSNRATAPTGVSRPSGTLQAQNNSPKPAVLTTQLSSSRVAIESSPMVETTNVDASSPTGGIKSKDISNSSSCNPPKERLLEDQVVVVSTDASNSILGNSSNEHVQDQTPISCNAPNEQHQ